MIKIKKNKIELPRTYKYQFSFIVNINFNAFSIIFRSSYRTNKKKNGF